MKLHSRPATPAEPTTMTLEEITDFIRDGIKIFYDLDEKKYVACGMMRALQVQGKIHGYATFIRTFPKRTIMIDLMLTCKSPVDSIEVEA
ncbi:hypothetical protein [Acinetobacter sp.]|uniref:hypothetical protein n=1 Tax=Acinetobacter sp. TaxID=472 RepID=UPI0038908CE3